MARLIVKSPYIKCGGGHGAGGYARYIGTRERVELVENGNPSTHGQEQSDVYMKYIATRPRAERLGSHGLFGDEEHVDLNAAMDELDHYTGNVWTHIISLSREDAVRYGYDHAEAWRNLLRAHRNVIAEAMHIPPNNFRWYAAFHNEGHHPHVHMMAWSTKPGQARLNRDGIAKIKSVLTNDVFRQELVQVMTQKSDVRNELVQETRDTLRELAREMRRGVADCPAIEQQLAALSQELNNIGGKHSYGYLKKPLKEKVDAIVDELERLPVVSECYDRWLELQNQVDGFYKDEKRKRVRLSEQKEFRQIKNAVIKIADQLRSGEVTFEDRDMRMYDEQDDGDACASDDYWNLKYEIDDSDLSLNERREATQKLEMLAESGDADAQFLLGKLYRDGDVLIPDTVNAAYWFERTAKQGVIPAQYALGKLLLSADVEVHDAEQGLRWLEVAAQNGSDYAAYRLGKECLKGEHTAKDIEKAVSYFEQSADAGNLYAQYTLGKLYLAGDDVERNATLGLWYMEQSASQGNEYAQFFIDRQDSLTHPDVMLAVTRLQYALSKVFQQNSTPQTGPRFAVIDRKRRREMLDKRIAMGHREDDHEDAENYKYMEPAMSIW